MFQIAKPINTSSVNISTLRCLQKNKQDGTRTPNRKGKKLTQNGEASKVD